MSIWGETSLMIIGAFHAIIIGEVIVVGTKILQYYILLLELRGAGNE